VHHRHHYIVIVIILKKIFWCFIMSLLFAALRCK